MAALTVAIVGSGPAGCYTAERLARQGRGAVEIDVFDRLPTPFGLVRGGVAPDHQGTKAIARVLARALSQDRVRFFGHVEIGRDLSIEDLKEAYDAVVLAVGAPGDRRLGVPGEDLQGVVGSAAFVGWYNGHPDHAGLSLAFERVRTAVVIGNGNVAVDVARVLCRAGCEMENSDIDPAIEARLASAPLARIVIAGRRGPSDVRFSPAELEELGRLDRAHPVVDAEAIAAGASETPALAVLRAFWAMPPAGKPIRLEFRFHLRPEAFVDDGAARLQAVRFRRTREEGGRWVETEAVVEIPAELAVTCVGYRCAPCGGLAPEDGVFRNRQGRIADGLYVVGWAGRGPSGTIATNRAEGHALADRILAEIAAQGKPGRRAIEGKLAAVEVVDFDGWTRIDRAEVERAPGNRVRRKLTRIEDLVAAAGGGRGAGAVPPLGGLDDAPS